MRDLRVFLLWLMALALGGVATLARADEAKGPVSFTRDVAPILLKHCQACHGAPEPKGGYQVTNYNLVIKPGESESPAVEAGKPDDSILFMLVNSSDADSRMPKEADPLTAEHIELIKRWIAEGAKYDGTDPAAPLTAIIPKLPQPDPPTAYRRTVPVSAVAFNQDGSELAVSGYREVTIWNATTGALLRRIKNVAERTQSLSYNPDGSLLAVAGGIPGQMGEVKLFRPADGTLVREVVSIGDVAYRAVFNPAGDKLAVAGADRAIRVFDVATGKQEILIEDHADWVVGLAWNHDGTRLVSASRDKTSKLFNAANGESLATYSGHGDSVFAAGFSADGKLVFSGGGDKKIHAWNPDDAAKKGEIAGFAREVLALVTSGDKILSGSADKSVQQHRVEGFKPFKTYAGNTDAVFCVAFHAATGRIASGSFNGQVRVWNAEDGSPVVDFVAAPGLATTAPMAAAK